MLSMTVEIDQRRIREIQRIFRQFPNEVGRLMRDSINRTATKARKNVVDRLAATNPGLKKKNIRKATKIKPKASLKRWSASVNVKGPGIPLIDMGAKLGRKTKVTEIATAKQSAWLFYNVFKPKYGSAAVYSTAYRLVKKVRQNITYKEGGVTKSLAGTGAFVATMKTGHKGIFKRRDGFGGQAIREMRGPSVGEMLNQSRIVMSRIEQDAAKGLEVEIDKRVKSYLARAKAKARGAA